MPGSWPDEDGERFKNDETRGEKPVSRFLGSVQDTSDTPQSSLTTTRESEKPSTRVSLSPFDHN
jgi:hypothetical protein